MSLSAGISSFQQKYKVKLFKFFLSETTITKAQIFGMQHCLADLYQGCQTNATRVKIGLNLFSIEVYSEIQNHKHQSLDIKFWHVALSSGPLSQVPEIMALGLKLVPPRESVVFHIDLHNKIFKTIFVPNHKHQSQYIWYVALPVDSSLKLPKELNSMHNSCCHGNGTEKKNVLKNSSHKA